MRHSDPEWVIAALDALRVMGDLTPLDDVRALTSHREARVRAAAAAVAFLGGEVAQAAVLNELAHSPDAGASVEALRALLHIGLVLPKCVTSPGFSRLNRDLTALQRGERPAEPCDQAAVTLGSWGSVAKEPRAARIERAFVAPVKSCPRALDQVSQDPEVLRSVREQKPPSGPQQYRMGPIGEGLPTSPEWLVGSARLSRPPRPAAGPESPVRWRDFGAGAVLTLALVSVVWTVWSKGHPRPAEHSPAATAVAASLRPSAVSGVCERVPPQGSSTALGSSDRILAGDLIRTEASSSVELVDDLGNTIVLGASSGFRLTAVVPASSPAGGYWYTLSDISGECRVDLRRERQARVNFGPYGLDAVHATLALRESSEGMTVTVTAGDVTVYRDGAKIKRGSVGESFVLPLTP